MYAQQLSFIPEVGEPEMSTTVVGRIYFIQAGDGGEIKIGFSDNPDERIRPLQTGNPKELKFLVVIAGTKLDEKRLHRKFRSHRIRMNGEWFRPAKELLDYIRSLVAGGKGLPQWAGPPVPPCTCDVIPFGSTSKEFVLSMTTNAELREIIDNAENFVLYTHFARGIEKQDPTRCAERDKRRAAENGSNYLGSY